MINYLNVGALEQSEQANEGEGKAVKIEMKNYDFYFHNFYHRFVFFNCIGNPLQ